MLSRRGVFVLGDYHTWLRGRLDWGGRRPLGRSNGVFEGWDPMGARVNSKRLTAGVPPSSTMQFRPDQYSRVLKFLPSQFEQIL